jgi:hypothetical protein
MSNFAYVRKLERGGSIQNLQTDNAARFLLQSLVIVRNTPSPASDAHCSKMRIRSHTLLDEARFGTPPPSESGEVGRGDRGGERVGALEGDDTGDEFEALELIMALTSELLRLRDASPVTRAMAFPTADDADR